MKRLVLVALFALTVPAVAQQVPQSENITIRVTAAELGIVGKALSALPYSEVAALMGKLQKQIDDHAKAKEPKPKPKEE